MTVEELERELRVHGLVCRVRGEEVALHVCCYCGNEKFNCELNAERSLFHCWSCRRGGGLGEVLHFLTGKTYNLPRTARGPRDHAQKVLDATQAQQNQELRVVALEGIPSAAQYVERRGIPLHRAAGYGMGVCRQEGHLLQDRIVVPMYSFWGHELVGWVGRNYTGGHPKYISTLPSGGAIVTGWRMRMVEPTPIVLVEGPFDGIAVHEAGFDAAVLAGSGMNAKNLAEWAGRITTPTPALVVFLDADASERSRKLYWQLQTLCSVPVMEVRPPDGQDPAQLGSEWIRTTLSMQVSALQATVRGQ